MKTLFAAVFAMLASFSGSSALETDFCAVPTYLVAGDNALDRVSAALQKVKELKVLVVGTTSSMLPGPEGTNIAYPARLEAALKRRLPAVDSKVVTSITPRQTAAEMVRTLDKLLLDEKPNLVVWQTGTFDALRGIDPEEFRATVAEGVEIVQAGGADVILVNMQYSPRTEMMIAVSGYADSMRWVAREREVPLFDRLAIMRYWNDTGAIDLYAATKDISLAKRVHDCIGRALASLVIDAAQLETMESKAR
jgi:lysophospholipase L1-like esterase